MVIDGNLSQPLPLNFCQKSETRGGGQRLLPSVLQLPRLVLKVYGVSIGPYIVRPKIQGKYSRQVMLSRWHMAEQSQVQQTSTTYYSSTSARKKRAICTRRVKPEYSRDGSTYNQDPIL